MAIRHISDIRPYTRWILRTQLSPNRTLRLLAPHLKPQVWLIHATVSSNMESPLNLFMNRGGSMDQRVSSDFVIGKDGQFVRCCPKGWAAWHAGVCTWNGKPVNWYNHLSYGLELVNWNNGVDPYPEVQLEAMAYVMALIQLETPTVVYVRRHADVAYPHGRKSDPDGLTLEDIYRAARYYQPGLEIR